MIVVVDANIIISGIINPKGIIPYLLFTSNDRIDFVAPQFVVEEIQLHQAKICRAANISIAIFKSLFNAIKQQLFIFSDDMIDVEHLNKALLLTKTIDEKDTIYVAFTIALDALLWTGDLKLKNALRKKGFENAVSTKQLQQIINGL
jgi:predicted nucleic acid-binding protein